MDQRYRKSYERPDGPSAPAGPVPCPNCGNPLPPGTPVCGACGKKIESAAAPGANKSMLLVAVGVAVLIAAGAAMFILTAQGPSPAPQPAGPAASLSIPKHEYDPAEEIRVRFTAPAAYDKTAWIGIVPSRVPHGNEVENDMHDLTYQYLQNLTEGEFVFFAPSEPGDYDFRMHDTDSNGRETFSVSFVVRSSGPAAELAPSLALSRREFKPGEEILVDFTAPSTFDATAWVGVIPGSVAHGEEAVNDQHDLSFQYLNKKTSGRLVFTAPFQLGEYDLRMNDSDNNGREVASQSFTVALNEQAPDEVDPANLNRPLIGEPEAEDLSPGLELDAYEFPPGAAITARFTAPASYPADAWVGIVPSEVEHGREVVNDQHDLTFQHLNKRTSGTLTFTAPSRPGQYDLRMNDSDRDGAETASVSFTVAADGGGEPE